MINKLTNLKSFHESTVCNLDGSYTLPVNTHSFRVARNSTGMKTLHFGLCRKATEHKKSCKIRGEQMFFFFLVLSETKLIFNHSYQMIKS